MRSLQKIGEIGIHWWLYLFIYFFYLGSVISDEDGSRGDILKYKGKAGQGLKGI